MPRTIATNTPVDLDGLLDFVRPRHHMLVITSRADGRPQASPVTGGVDDSGRIVISSYRDRAKTANARKRPEVSVLVLSDEIHCDLVLDPDKRHVPIASLAPEISRVRSGSARSRASSSREEKVFGR